ncbi:MAG: hypothetical protein QXK19_04460 [Nitrososphaerota archaeon]
MNTSRLIKKLVVKFVRMFRPEIYIVRNFNGEVVIISRDCPVCVHPERIEIDRKVMLAQSIRELAEEYGFRLDDLVEHFSQHVIKAEKIRLLQYRYLERRFVRYIDLQEELLKLVDRLNLLFGRLEKFDEQSIDVSRSKPTARDYIASISERRKIIGEIRETLHVINKLKNEVKNEKDLTEILKKLGEPKNCS